MSLYKLMLLTCPWFKDCECRLLDKTSTVNRREAPILLVRKQMWSRKFEIKRRRRCSQSGQWGQDRSESRATSLNMPFDSKKILVVANHKVLGSGDRLISESVTSPASSSLQDAPLSRTGRLLCGTFHGDEPDLQAAGGERRAVLGLRLPGAQQADEASQHQVPDPQHPAAGTGSQHQPGHDPPAAAQSASSDAAPGPVRPAGGGRGPRHDRDHHHHGYHA